MTPLGLAWREIRHRPIHAGLFALSVALGAGTLLGISGFSAALEHGVRLQARELWAADVTVEGSPPFLDVLESWAKKRWPNAPTARSVETLSMVRSPKTGRVSQVTLSGVTPGYPLYGALKVSSGGEFQTKIRRGLIATPKVLALTGLTTGETLLINDVPFPIEDVLTERTDAPSSFFELAPSLFISLDALDKTGLLAPGSRSRATLFLNAPPGTPVDSFYKDVRERAAEETAEVRTWATDNPGVFRFVQNTLTYLTFLSLLTLVLGGIGVASALTSALGASVRSMGMMLAIGASRKYLLQLWLSWSVVLLTVGLFGGLVLGRVVSLLLTRLFGDMIPIGVTLGFPAGALLRAVGVSGAATALFVFLPLANIVRWPPHVLLAQDDEVFRRGPKTMGLYGAVAAPVFFLIVWSQLGRPTLALGYVAALAGLGVCASLLVAAGVGIIHRLPSPRRIEWALARRGLRRRGTFQTASMVSLALGVSAVLALGLVRFNLTEQFVKSFPENMPNVFFINIQKSQVDRFRELVGAPMRLFPLVRGRVLSVNGTPVSVINKRAKRASPGGDGLTREFGFSFGNDVLATDKVVSGGSLWNPEWDGPQVSCFVEHHKRFGLRVGDTVAFNVLGRKISARVSSLRAIDQSARQPFFYFYFKPGVLDDAPHTLMGGACLPSERVADVQRKLADRLPNVTTVDLTEVAKVSGRVLTRLARVVNALGVFSFGASLVLLISGLMASFPERRREAVLYRTLGASGGQVALVYGAEFGIRALLAGTVAAVVAMAAAGSLLEGVMDVPFRVPWAGLVWGLMGATTFITAVSFGVSLPALGATPMEVLRYE